MSRKMTKSGLLAGASALAIATVLATSPAHAFNEVNWSWNADLVTDVNITIDLNPGDLVMVEDLQVSIGDVTATSTVSGINNTQPAGGNGNGGGSQVVDLGQLQFSGNYDQTSGDVTANGNNIGNVATEAKFLAGTVNTVPGNNGVTMNFDLGTITVEFEPNAPGEALDAVTELGEVVSAATAVANNTSITSNTSVFLHEGQFAFGGGGDVSNGDLQTMAAVVNGMGGVNSNLVGAGVLGTAAMLGAIEPAAISASSTVSDILNASVDSSATAVANNLTLSVESAGGQSVVADIVQFSFADVSATSSVTGVSLNSYTNLGSIDRPIVSSVATAIGNNKSITVGVAPVSVPQ